MPAIAPGDKVLVTGANGFLAAHIVDILLKNGYAVRGVVRSLEKEDHLQKLFGQYEDKFELVVVEDITVVCYTSLHPTPNFQDADLVGRGSLERSKAL